MAYDLLKSDETIDWLDAEKILNSIVEGVVLPKGHGKLIFEPTKEEIAKTIGGQNDFAECIRDSVKAVFDNAPTIIEADKEREDEQTMLIEFIKDFANNWKAGDIVKAEYLEKDEVLVDGVAKIDTRSLLEHCRVISESKDTYKTYVE